jgi:hypothetical protein
MNRLTEHFTPQHNIDYEIYLLSTSPTTKWDALSIYHSSVPTGLNLQIYLCWEMKLQIILNCSLSYLHQWALHVSSLTLKALLDLGCAMEISEKQASDIESKSISPDETELLNYTRMSQCCQSRQSPSGPFRLCNNLLTWHERFS